MRHDWGKGNARGHGSRARRKRLARREGCKRHDLRLKFESLEPRRLLAGQPMISEFMAINDTTLADSFGQYEDWLELHNPDSESVNLNGWTLKDDNNEWTLPDITLGPGEYRVIFASGNDLNDPAAELHTNFSLKGSGEYLGLLDDLGTVVHEYDEYPEQYADISYGIAQDIDTTYFVAAGDEAAYLIPSGNPGAWTTTGFDDSGWSTGDTGLGFTDMVPGFAVDNYKATSEVGSLAIAENVIESPGLQSYVNSETASTINYYNSGGHGRYSTGEANFPGFTGDMDDFVIEATGYVTIPSAGQWSFGVNSDDGFGLTIDGGTYSMEFPGLRGANDTIQTFDFASAGTYSIRLVYFERGGGSEVELFAAPGAYTSFSSAAFDLVGDTANGGLEVVSESITGGSSGSTFSNLVETDLEAAMEGINATAYARMTFNVDDPALYESLTLKMKYDGGYVAYLNGHEIARRNAPASPVWNSAATDERTDEQAVLWENVDVTADLGHLLTGENVLAIHGMNSAVGDGDFLLLPELVQNLYLGLGEHYFAFGTPGDPNTEEYWLYVEDTSFSHDRGFYEEAFNLAIETDTVGADIFYTTDGSAPTESHGTLYTGPISISGSTVVRARAYKDNYAPTNIDTQTYLFFDDVLGQSDEPEDFPTSWGGEPADYEMDPEILPTLETQEWKDALLSLPTMSLVMDPDDLFDASTGIYSNPNTQGWERAASLEYFDENGSGEFQVDAGARIYGGVGRQPRFKKHSFRLLFKADYGPTKLDYPLFGDGAVDSFDTIILRSNFNDAWVWGGDSSQFVRDEFLARVQNAMGDPGRHGEFVHLYINGLYWGLYNPVERPDTSFSASYFGGDKDNWDGINSTQPTGESETDAWNALMNMSPTLTTNAGYQQVQGNNEDGTNNPAYEDYLDIDNYINYLLANFYGGNNDWISHNWYAGRERGSESTGFKSYSWDAEWILDMRSGLNDNAVNDKPTSNYLLKPYTYLSENAEFQLRFADHIHEHMFNGGVLTTENTLALYQSLADQVELSVYTESLRWGDVVSTNPFDYGDWANERDYLLNTYLPQRTDIVLQQLKDANLYPATVAPTFNINGSYQHGGPILDGDALTITAPAGTIYYTTDGSDPRELYGAVAPGALTYSGAVTLSEGTHVMARVLSAGGEWSALNQGTFYIDLAPSIRITEIMYNPADPTPAEIGEGYLDADEFEFIEITNISTIETLPLAGLRFNNGIDFTFPDISIAPSESMVVVKNQDAFDYRYPGYAGTIAGEYLGLLNNGGEKVELEMPVGGIIHEFNYKDGWYDHTDGDGFSLTIRDPNGELELWDQKIGWRASAAPGGSPGGSDTLVDPGSIIITEVLAHTNTPLVDAIELYNTSDSPVDISGWFLSDQKKDDLGNEVLNKYQIPAMAPIPAGEYIALYENTHFGTEFSLSELGDDVYLSSNAGGVAGGYREHVDFGASPSNKSIGLFTKSTGGTDFTILATPTFGPSQAQHVNAAPYMEDLVINEVMYHALDPTSGEAGAGFLDDDQFEYIEIYNKSTTTTYTLSDYYIGNGIGFTFGWYGADDFGNESWTLEPGSTATWNATLPAGLDTYEVFARWDLLDGEADERDLDGRARYQITHDGGSAVVFRDQEPELDDEGPDYQDEFGWVSLGTYQFDGSGQVVLTRGTTNPDNWTIADQVKFVSTGHTEIVDNPTLDSWYTANGPTTIAPGGYVVIVSDYDAFDYRYDVAGNAIPVAGTFTGSLDNNGEKIKLFRQGTPEPTGYIPYYRIDYVNYDDNLPWPVEPDGTGASLNRTDTSGYGNDPIHWEAGASGGTPGAANVVIDRTAPSVPGNLVTQVTLDPDQIELSWDAAVDLDSYVDHYVVYRDGEWYGTSATTVFFDNNVARATDYSYQVSAVNRDGYQSDLSTAIVIAIPGIETYAVPDDTHIEITFSEPLDPATAEVLGNYVFTGGTLASVDLLPNGLVVVLTTAEALIPSNHYTVTANDLTTLSGNEMPTGLMIAFDYASQGSGQIFREYWSDIGGSSIANLTGDADYPGNPTGSGFLTSLEGPTSFGDNYGTRIRGYVHPPMTGEFTFWVAGDDNSELWLSTDANPANKVLIASVPDWSGSRDWDKYAEQQSAPITLSAGQKYYIEVLHKEGTGGDNIAVRWQLPDGTWENPANPDEPIPGIRLSPYTGDVEPPIAGIMAVDPDPRDTAVSEITIVFNEPITGFDLGDLALTRDGGPNLLTNQSLVDFSDQIWTLSGLTSITSAGGSYNLTLTAAGSGIQDGSGNFLLTDAVETWTNIPPGPTVDIVDVSPDPRATAVGEIQIVFSQAVTGFDVDDLILSLDSGPNLLTGGESLTTTDNTTFTLGGLSGLTDTTGTYTLSLSAAGSGIESGSGQALASDASDSWYADPEAPTADVVDVTPDPRDSGVDSVEIVFSEPVTGLDIDDLSLVRDGGANLLTGSQSLSTTDNTTWTLSGLSTLTGGGGSGFVAFNDHVPDYGDGTHANTTAYSAMNGEVPSGLLKDITTGADTGVTLTVTASGISYAGSQANPAAGTDAYDIFNGYVDLSSDGDGGASLEVEADDNDYYNYEFSGLDTGDGATYNFHGTAVRGRSSYIDRWTLVTLIGADSFTAAHSSGVGVVTAGLAPNQVAIWTGYNAAADQGFVAAWTGIDPGSDGVFEIRSEQYTGAVPTSVNPSGMADGSKGYGLGGVRIEEVADDGIPGIYTLALTATGSEITDGLGNALDGDTSDTWIISGAPDTDPPTVDIVDVAPDPRNTTVDQIEIVFSEAVTGFGLGDLSLTLGGGANLLTGGESLTSADDITWTFSGLAGLTGASGDYTLTLSATGSGITDLAGNPLSGDASDTWAAQFASTVVGRHVFYNNSAFDGNDTAAGAADDAAVATDKTALLPGGGKATFDNYTSYSRGINGIMIDVDNLPTTSLTAADFLFHTGNDDTPDDWDVALSPSVDVRAGAGVGGSDRITLIWPDGEIAGSWLEVTVKANAQTGLTAADVFYFGNAIGETGDSTTDAMVTSVDEIDTRHNPQIFTPATVENLYDFNRDRKVTATDQIIARHNVTFFDALQLITIPASPPPAPAAAPILHDAAVSQGEPASRDDDADTLAKTVWLYDFEQFVSDGDDADDDADGEAVDQVLVELWL